MKDNLVLNLVQQLKGGRRTECQYCNMSFTSENSQRRHTDKVHLDKCEVTVGNSSTSYSNFSSCQVSDTLIKEECLESDLLLSKPSLSRQSSTSECVIHLQHEENEENENDSSRTMKKQQQNSMHSVIQIISSSEDSRQEKPFVKSENQPIKQEEFRPYGEAYNFKPKYGRKFIDAMHEFSCDICGRCFQQKNRLLRHMSVHSNYRKFSCVKCGSRFKRKDDMDRHVKREVCVKSTRKRQERALQRSYPLNTVKEEPIMLQQQGDEMELNVKEEPIISQPQGDEMELNVKEEPIISQPQGDATELNVKEEPLILQQERDQSKPMIKEEDDQFIFSSVTSTNLSHFDQHMETFRCYNCYFPFTHEDHLEIHLKNEVCTKLKRPAVVKAENKCEVKQSKTGKKKQNISVGSAISRKYQLRRKRQLTMTLNRSMRMPKGVSDIVCIDTSDSELDTEEQNVCVKCGKCFAEKILLDRHMNFAHSDNFKYTCETCDTKFNNSYHLSYHLESKECLKPGSLVSHSVTPEYPCKNCLMPFQREDSLTEHINKQSCYKPKILPRSLFNCVVILSKVKKKPSLSANKVASGSRHRHMADLRKYLWKHERPKRFKCEICSRACDSVAKLRRHYSVHSQARPFGCKICNRSYKYKEDLKKHHLHAHPLEPWLNTWFDTSEVKCESQVLSISHTGRIL